MCLTGTPFANDCSEIQALFVAVGIPPFQNKAFLKSYVSTPRQTTKNDRIEIPSLEANRAGILTVTLAAATVRRQKRAPFDDEPLTQLKRPIAQDVEVELDTTGRNPRGFEAEEE